jgi:hypothetical protein
MDERCDVDPNDWRTWPRDGRRLLPPADATESYCVTAMCEYSAAAWGVDLSRPRKSRRDVIRVLKKVDGRYEQVMFRRGSANVRVRGGCRLITAD